MNPISNPRCLAIVAIFYCLFSASMWADTFGDFTYTSDGTAITITGYPKTATGSVTIPRAIAGRPVSTIGSNAFSGCLGLTTITMPDSITTIGSFAFGQCDGLASISISSKVLNIETGAFATCKNLTAITVAAGNPNYTSGAGGVLLNKSRTAILQCPGRKSGEYVIPSGVTVVGQYAFSGCIRLTSIMIPASVRTIEGFAFRDCDGLSTLHFPANVETLPVSAFLYASNLSSITVDPSNATFSAVSGVLLNKARDTIIRCPEGKSGAYAIPAGVRTVSSQAFFECELLTSLTLPTSLTGMEGECFRGCSALTSVVLPNSLSSIPAYAFNYCVGLRSVTIPSTITSIGIYAFSNCTSLPGVSIPRSVTNIGDYAFAYCGALNSMKFQGNAPTMGTGVFDNGASGFRIYYHDGKAGFTWPSWYGFPTSVLGPEITVQQPLGTFLVDGSGSRSFGTVPVGNTGAAKSFVIRNIGSLNLTGLSITVDGTNPGDFIVSPLSGSALVPGDSRTFTVKFKPTGGMNRKANIHITTNDPNENPFDIKTTGFGAVP